MHSVLKKKKSRFQFCVFTKKLVWNLFSLGKMYTKWLLIEMSGTKRMKNKLGTRHLHQPPTTITIYILRHSVNGAAYLLSTILYAEYSCGFKFPYIYYVDAKTQTISLFNNSEKLVLILLEFSQQIVEGYEFVLAKFSWKRPFQSTKIRVELLGRILRLCTKCDESIVYKNFDITVAHCGAWRAWALSSSDI